MPFWCDFRKMKNENKKDPKSFDIKGLKVSQFGDPPGTRTPDTLIKSQVPKVAEPLKNKEIRENLTPICNQLMRFYTNLCRFISSIKVRKKIADRLGLNRGGFFCF